MRLKPGARWMPFTAVCEYQVRRVGFSWQARFPVAPALVWLSIVDEYDEDASRMEGRVWGIVPFMRTRGEAVQRAQALRYLSELPWTPYSMARNPALEWRDAGENEVEVATAIGHSRVGFRFQFAANGDIVGGSTSSRPRQVGKATIDTPWAGRFEDYASFGAVRIPRFGEVWWELPEGPFAYWQGRMTRVTSYR
jgi:hypothetical protein